MVTISVSDGSKPQNQAITEFFDAEPAEQILIISSKLDTPGPPESAASWMMEMCNRNIFLMWSTSVWWKNCKNQQENNLKLYFVAVTFYYYAMKHCNWMNKMIFKNTLSEDWIVLVFCYRIRFTSLQRVLYRIWIFNCTSFYCSPL